MEVGLDGKFVSMTGFSIAGVMGIAPKLVDGSAEVTAIASEGVDGSSKTALVAGDVALICDLYCLAGESTEALSENLRITCLMTRSH